MSTQMATRGEVVLRELIRLGDDPKLTTKDRSNPLYNLNLSASLDLVHLPLKTEDLDGRYG